MADHDRRSLAQQQVGNVGDEGMHAVAPHLLDQRKFYVYRRQPHLRKYRAEGQHGQRVAHQLPQHHHHAQFLQAEAEIQQQRATHRAYEELGHPGTGEMVVALKGVQAGAEEMQRKIQRPSQADNQDHDPKILAVDRIGNLELARRRARQPEGWRGRTPWRRHRNRSARY